VLAEAKTAALSFMVASGDPSTLAEATPVEKLDILAAVAAVPKPLYAEWIGMMAPNRKDGQVVFKSRNATRNRSAGYRCDQKGKLDVLRSLNRTLDAERYTYEGTKKLQSARELCVDHELLLRHYDAVGEQGKRWFVDLVEGMLEARAAGK